MRLLASLLAFAALALATPSGLVLAQTPTPAGSNPPVSSPPPTKPASETPDRPPDLSPPKPEPETQPKGRWGPVDQYNKNTKCYIAGRYVPAPPLCPN